MHRLSLRQKGRIRGAVYSLFVFLSLLFAPWVTGAPLAEGVFSASEQIYLKNITPLLYEFSQAASGVSASLLKLQSSPPEECASKFADWMGIVGSISNRLGSLTPPPRLDTVHGYATEALDGYSSGLELYFKACTEEDFGVKESLVSRGGIFINKSVVSVGKAYDEIENLKAAGPAAVKKDTVEEITEGDITEGGISEDASPGEADIEGETLDTAGTNPPPQDVKTKQEMLEEISRRVQSDMEAREASRSESPVPDGAAGEAPPAARPANVVSGPEPPAVDSEVRASEKVETPEAPAAEPAPPPSENTQVKTGEAAPAEAPVIEEETAEPPQDEAVAVGEEPKEEEKSDEVDIERLNQKIMEQAKAAGIDTSGADSGESETQEPRLQDEGKGAETAPGSSEAAPSNSDEVAALPPGGADEGHKEEGVPVDDVKSWCQERYRDPAEQKNCMISRAVAKDKIDKLTNAFANGSRERGVLDKCKSDWKEGGTYNYEMVISCTQFFCTQGGIEDCKDLSK